jgi:hypothetical protein
VLYTLQYVGSSAIYTTICWINCRIHYNLLDQELYTLQSVGSSAVYTIISWINCCIHYNLLDHVLYTLQSVGSSVVYTSVFWIKNCTPRSYRRVTPTDALWLQDHRRRYSKQNNKPVLRNVMLQLLAGSLLTNFIGDQTKDNCSACL